MSQVSTGIRSILSNPILYETFQNMIGAKKSRKRFVDDFVKPFSGSRIIDIGCGPAEILNYFPQDIEYFGFDFEQNYIEAAEKIFGNRGTFICEDVESFLNNNTNNQSNYFDIALASGILHHLDDKESVRLLKVAKSALKKGGKLFTFDPIYVKDQSFFSRYIISKDRGQNVRTLNQYLKIAYTVFSNVEYQILNDMLRIPYTHIIMTLS